MKNAIKYFYNLEPENIIQTKNYYTFIINDEKYYLKVYELNINISEYLNELNENMLKQNILVHQIILNKDKKMISLINNIYYYLTKIYINEQVKINLSEISYLANKQILYNKKLIRNDWAILWSEKIDYLESQINEMGKKYPILVDSFNYFISLSENAISYVTNTNHELKPTIYDKSVLSHIKIKPSSTLLDFYDPTNLIIDHKSRDVAEYIKNSFFQKNKNIFEELDEYFKHNIYSEYGIRLLFARVMYPSFYFDLYDEVITNTSKENTLSVLIKNINEYENYLKEIFLYLHKFYNIKEIEWITKKRNTIPR